jgi:L-rhamnose mutarotase
MKRYCLACDLKDDPELIAAYEAHHENVWPEILESIKTSGIERMEIYRVSNRLFMIMEVKDSFTFERKALLDLASTKVQQWELLMWKYQQKLPFARPGEKWMLMEKIFSVDF